MALHTVVYTVYASNEFSRVLFFCFGLTVGSCCNGFFVCPVFFVFFVFSCVLWRFGDGFGGRVSFFAGTKKKNNHCYFCVGEGEDYPPGGGGASVGK